MPPTYISYQEKLIELQSKQKTEITATVYKLSVDSFEVESEIVYTCKQSVKILTSRSVLEVLTCEIVPCFLARTASQYYLFAINSNLTKIFPVRKVDVSEANTLFPRKYPDLQILDGPIILSVEELVNVFASNSDDGDMYILKQQCYDICSLKENFCTCLDKGIVDDTNTVKSNRINVLHVTFTCEEYFLFLKYKGICKCSQNKTDGLSVLKYCNANGFLSLNNEVFVPLAYQSHLTCLYHYISTWKSYSGYQIVNRVIFGTTDGFVIEAENGKLTRCTSMSVYSKLLIATPQPIRWIFISPNKLDSSQNEVLIFQHNNAVVLKTGLGVIKSWTGITKILPCGYNDGQIAQFLLFRGTTIQDGWILTDLNSLEIFSDKLELGKGDAKDESLGSAIEALERRLQDERFALYEKEQQYRSSERITRDISYRQLHLLEMTQPSPKAENADYLDYLPLTEAKLDNSGAPDSQQFKAEAIHVLDIEIVDVWQRTYGNNRLVAVSFRNNTNSDLLVSVSLTPSHHSLCPESLTCHSTTILSKGQHEQSNLSECDRNQSKWPKIELKETTNVSQEVRKVIGYCEPDIVACKTDLPNFSGLNSYSVRVLLRCCSTSSVGSSNKMDLDKLIKDTRTTKDKTKGMNLKVNLVPTFSRHCGEIELNVVDVISGKYELDMATDTGTNDIEMQDLKDMKRDSAALRRIQQTVLLEMRAASSVLLSLEQLLIDRCQFMFNQRLSCFVSKIISLSKVQLQLEPFTGGCKRTVISYTSCRNELFLLVHHLYASLPDNVIILLQEMSAAEVMQSCFSSLHKELSLLEHDVRQLLSNSDFTGSESQEVGQEQEEDVRKVGEKFKRQRGGLMEKMRIEVNKGKLREIFEQLMRQANETDLDIVRAFSKM